jgi:hypothetical protein
MCKLSDEQRPFLLWSGSHWASVWKDSAWPSSGINFSLYIIIMEVFVPVDIDSEIMGSILFFNMYYMCVSRSEFRDNQIVWIESRAIEFIYVP